MSALPGVRVGPLDPDSTSAFGQVAQRNSARQLIRLHRQQYPAALRRQLARPIDVPRTNGLELDEVRGYLKGLAHPNGDPVLPEDSRLVGAAVRGDRESGHVLTFQYELPSGRIGKWHAPYDAEALPDSFDAGARLAQVHEMRQKGLVSFDEGGTRSEILDRQNRQQREEIRRLREYIEGGMQGDAPDRADEPGAEQAEKAQVDTSSQTKLLEDLEQSRREAQELRERLAKFEALEQGAGGGMPTAGLEADTPDRDAQQRAAGDPPEDRVASADPPFEGYDELNAQQVRDRIKSDETSPDDVRAILEYERTHANRGTVVSCAEQTLDRTEG